MRNKKRLRRLAYLEGSVNQEVLQQNECLAEIAKRVGRKPSWPASEGSIVPNTDITEHEISHRR